MELLVREACVDDAMGIVAIMNPIIAAGVYTAFDTPFTIEAEQADADPRSATNGNRDTA